MDEEELQMKACVNLQSRGVRSKQMRHDGAMQQSNASVWKGASSLAAAKMELCKTMKDTPSRGDFDMGEMDYDVRCASDDLSESAASFSKKKRSGAAKGLGWLMSPFTGGSAKSVTRGPAVATRSKARSRAVEEEHVRSASPAFAARGGGMMAAPMCAAAAVPMSAPAPVEAKSLKSNVLVEEEISYDQVKRIMKRKSAK